MLPAIHMATTVHTTNDLGGVTVPVFRWPPVFLSTIHTEVCYGFTDQPWEEATHQGNSLTYRNPQQKDEESKQSVWEQSIVDNKIPYKHVKKSTKSLRLDP